MTLYFAVIESDDGPQLTDEDQLWAARYVFDRETPELEDGGILLELTPTEQDQLESAGMLVIGKLGYRMIVEL